MILLIDNYDSFTFNLAHYLGELGAECDVRRNDSLTADEALALRPAAIIISPGPGRPETAGISMDLAHRSDVPLLGVCLGHQAIAAAHGATVDVGDEIVHGKISDIRHEGEGLFAGLPSPFRATRYHSLVVKPETLPDMIDVTATTGAGTVMAIAHRDRPLHGIQFHPESIATEGGHDLLANFLALTGLR